VLHTYFTRGEILGKEYGMKCGAIGNTKYPKISIHETKESENEGTQIVKVLRLTY
jgi:hypothetical protein